MRKLRTGGRLIALMAVLGVATACGSMPVSSAVTAVTAVTSAKHATVKPAGRARSETVAANQSEIVAVNRSLIAAVNRSEIIAAKEHGIAVVQKPGVKHADLLSGVSCADARCLAVGGYYYGTAREYTLVELWNGRTWSLEPAPEGPRYSSLAAISCTAGGSCLAVGNPVLAGSGGHWRIVAKTSDLVADSCTGSGTCVAVGNETQALVFATWDGRVWRTGAMHAPPPQAQEYDITGVSCALADNCLAVGNYSYGVKARPSPSARDKTLAEQWNGRTWRLLPTIDVSHTDMFAAVSCAGPADCTAIGANQSNPLAEHWNGKTWTVESMPTVSSVGYVQLTSVSCPAKDFCMASGTYQGQPIAESWDGKEWRITRLPQPPVDNHSAQLTGVSCASTRACLAVGISGAATAYAERYAAGKWHLSPAQNPQ